MAMVPLTTVLKRLTTTYKTEDGDKIDHLLYMDYLTLYGSFRNNMETLIQTVRIYSTDIGLKRLDQINVLKSS